MADLKFLLCFHSVCKMYSFQGIQLLQRNFYRVLACNIEVHEMKCPYGNSFIKEQKVLEWSTVANRQIISVRQHLFTAVVQDSFPVVAVFNT